MNTDPHRAADLIVAELESARKRLEAAIALAEQHGPRGCVRPIKKILDGLKAVEWPLRGVHPDDL